MWSPTSVSFHIGKLISKLRISQFFWIWICFVCFHPWSKHYFSHTWFLKYFIYHIIFSEINKIVSLKMEKQPLNGRSSTMNRNFAVLLFKTISQVWIPTYVFIWKLWQPPILEHRAKNPHLPLRSTLIIYLSFLTNVISHPFKTDHYIIVSLKSFKELNFIPNLNL